MVTDPKEIARRSIEEIWNNQNPDAGDELLAADFIAHDSQSPVVVNSREAHKQFVRYYLNALPDLHFAIEAQVAEGENVVTRWTATGTHRGDLAGIPATGRHVRVTGMTHSRIENAKVVESWSNWDTLGLLQQLGLAPGSQVEQAA